MYSIRETGGISEWFSLSLSICSCTHKKGPLNCLSACGQELKKKQKYKRLKEPNDIFKKWKTISKC